MAIANALNETGTGVQSLTSAGAFNGRTITGTANQISISNGDGTAGNPTLALTSTIYVTGISFDSGSNTLSNYAVSTFTPTLTNTGSAPTPTYSVQQGKYTRIGNRVIMSSQITLTNYVAGTGDTQFSSLPITSEATTNNVHTGSLSLAQVTFGASVLYYVATLAPNSTSCNIVGVKTAAATLNLVAAGPGTTTNIIFALVYEV